MRKILIFLLLAALIGSAGALPRWGPPNGFYTKQLEADTITADVISAGVNITSSGDLEADIGLGGGYDFTFGAGDGKMDLSAGTGIFKTTTGAVTVGPGDVTVSGNASFSRNVAYSLNATTSINTTLVDDNTKTVFGINAAAGNRSLTLPAANTVTGRLYMIAASADMGTNYVIVDTTGAAKIGGTNGADSLKSTSADAALSVISDGTNYLVLSKVGTWT